MQSSLEFILGLLERHFPAFASGEDFAGAHGQALRLWQRRGFLSRQPESNPVRSCPHCREGVPYRLGGRFVCAVCQSPVDHQCLHRWRFNLDAFLSWLAQGLKLKAGVRQVDEYLWQLGSLWHGDLRYECFFCLGGMLSQQGRQRLLAYRNALLLSGLPTAAPVDAFPGHCLSLLEILDQEKRSLKVTDLARVMHGGGAVRFDDESGAFWAGDQLLGHIPVDSTEYHLLSCLSQRIDEFVPYADIKHFVLHNSGSRDTTEEATFCQRLKSRIKKRVPRIDDFIATTNKGRGYQLRAHMEKTREA